MSSPAGRRPFDLLQAPEAERRSSAFTAVAPHIASSPIKGEPPPPPPPPLPTARTGRDVNLAGIHVARADGGRRACNAKNDQYSPIVGAGWVRAEVVTEICEAKES